MESISTKTQCRSTVHWWDGEYEGRCELPEGHRGPHFDDLSYWDEDGNEVDARDAEVATFPNVEGWVFAALCHWGSLNGDVQVVRIGERMQLYRISTNDSKPFAVVSVAPFEPHEGEHVTSDLA